MAVAVRAETMHWVTPTPLWAGAADDVAGGDREAMRRPALARFASDTFMDDLSGLLAADPGRLAQQLATPVSYRQRPAGAPATWLPDASRLKLFQPVHGHFNLVMASLVCRLAGLPDHTVKPAEAEQVGFVLRRLAPGSTDTDVRGELAWVASPLGSSWMPLPGGSEGEVGRGEELLPMFPVGYDDAGTPRRMWAGLVPTSSRETYRSSATSDQSLQTTGAPGGKADVDPRWNQFDLRVLGPLGDLQAKPPLRPVPDDVRPEASAFVLLDLADLLRDHVPGVWRALEQGTPPTAPADLALYLALRADPGVDWRGRLLDAVANWAVITGEQPGSVDLHCDLHDAKVDPTQLQDLFRKAVPGTAPTGPPAGIDLPKFEPAGQARYVVRCVYARPQCPGAEPVSAPSKPFAIAPFFDPDAPARPIRIPMPMETGIKDLRKFPKSVGFMLSNQLRGQMDRVKDLKKALDGEIADEEGFDLGVICQFSMPIITIVALLLLIVMVFVLNLVFWWAAFFRICIPVPLRSRS